MTELRDRYAPDHVTIASSQVRYGGAILDTVVDEVRLVSTGARMVREYIRHDAAVAVLAVREGTGGDEVLLIRQYRHPVRSLLWEIPAGLMDIEGEEAAVSAARELREETDMVAASLRPLVKFWTSPGCSDELIQVFLAEDLREAEEAFVRDDEEAEIEKRWFPLDDVVAAILAGQLASPSLVNGVLAYLAAK